MHLTAPTFLPITFNKRSNIARDFLGEVLALNTCKMLGRIRLRLSAQVFHLHSTKGTEWHRRHSQNTNKSPLTSFTSDSNNRTLFLQTAKPESPGLGFSENNVGIRSLCLRMPERARRSTITGMWQMLELSAKFNWHPKEKNVQCYAI